MSSMDKNDNIALKEDNHKDTWELISNSKNNSKTSMSASKNNSRRSSRSRIPVKIQKKTTGESPRASIPNKVMATVRFIKNMRTSPCGRNCTKNVETSLEVGHVSSTATAKTSSCAANFNFPVPIPNPRKVPLTSVSDTTRQQPLGTKNPKVAHPLRSSSDTTTFPRSFQDKQCQTICDRNDPVLTPPSLDEPEVIKKAPQRNVILSSLSSMFICGESGENISPEDAKKAPSSKRNSEKSQNVTVTGQIDDGINANQLENEVITRREKIDDAENKNAIETRFQIYKEPRKDTRIASFKYLPNSRSKGDPELTSNADSSYHIDKSSGGGTIVPRKNNMISPAYRNVSSTTYEGIFYRKKALIQKGSAFLRSRSNSSNNRTCGNDTHSHIHGHGHHQRTVLTKIITETNYEYEEEETRQDSSCSRVGTKYGKNAGKPISSRKAIMPNAKTKSGNVAITGKPQILPPPPTSNLEGKKSSDSNSQNVNRAKDTRRLRNNKCSNIPCMILPGHGDPHLELPDPQPKTDDSDGNVGKVNVRRNEPCEKCKVYKNLLSQSEATLRYLTQMLVLKDYELQSRAHNKDKGIPGRYSSSNVPTLNPLLMKEENNGENNSSTSPLLPPPPRAPKCVMPKFDLDEFIRKYFKNLLFTKDFQDSPFTTLQLFHVALAARDCMAQVVKKKLKHAEGILRQKYDILVSMKSSSSDPLDESVYFAVLDSYRRFVRFIYYYFKESIKHVENFEQTYISQQKDSQPEEPQSRMVYSQEQIVTINGERYTAVVIPIQKLSPQDENTGTSEYNNSKQSVTPQTTQTVDVQTTES